jgi:ribosomal protein S27E
VGEADPFIRFYCDNCGYKSTVSESYAGKTIRCPKCYYIIFIPTVESTGTTTGQSSPGKTKTSSQHSDYDLTLLDISEKEKNSTFQRGQTSISEETGVHNQELEEEPQEDTESAAPRKLPWFIDMFLYPISAPGLMNLGIFIGVPLVIQIVRLLLGPFGLVLALPSFIINILIGLYICWYFAECVRDSTGGGTRAPEAFATAGIGDMYHQSLHLVGCYLIFAGPVGFYFLHTNRTDAIYWSLLAYAVFFFPMGLLSVVMFGSLHGLNPIILIGSIFSTFFPYCGLVLVFGAIVLLTQTIPQTQTRTWITFVSGFIFLYIMLVIAHLLGRFYWRYQEKLNWEV